MNNLDRVNRQRSKYGLRALVSLEEIKYTGNNFLKLANFSLATKGLPSVINREEFNTICHKQQLPEDSKEVKEILENAGNNDNGC